MPELRDHPIVENLTTTGWPDGKEPPVPHCPICDEECSTVYVDLYGNVVGCENCIGTGDACDYDECFQEDEPDEVI